MPMLFKPAATLVAALTFVPVQAVAHWFEEASCNLEFNGAVAVTPELVRIESGGRELILTTANAMLIDGHAIELDAAQRAHVEEYAREIRATVPQIVEIAIEGIEVGLTAAAEVARAVFDAEPPQDLYALMDEVKERIDQRLYARDGSIYLDGNGIDALDESIADLEPRIEEIMGQLVGGALTAAGNVLSGGEGSFLERMEAFGARMERFQHEMEEKVGARAAGIEARAEELCDQVRALASAEDALQEAVPEARRIDLTKMSGGYL